MPSYDVTVSALFLKSDTVCYSEADGVITEYTSLNQAITSASEGATIEMIEDYTLSASSGAFTIDKKIIIHGNGKTVKCDGYLDIYSEIEIYDISLISSYSQAKGSAKVLYFEGGCTKATLNNVYIEDLYKYSADHSRGIQIDGSTTDETLDLTIKNSKIVTPTDGYPFMIYRKCDIKMENSTTVGYCVMNYYNYASNNNPNGSTLTATNCTFNAQNNYSGDDNNYSVFAFDGNGNSTLNCIVNLINCKVDADTVPPNKSYTSLVGTQINGKSSKSNLTVNVSGEETVINCGKFINEGEYKPQDDNHLVIGEGKYSKDPTSYLEEGYSASEIIDENGNTWWAVTKVSD